MSSAPPGDSEEEHGSGPEELELDEAALTPVAGVVPPAGELHTNEALLAEASAASPQADIALYEAEASVDAQSDPKRAARLLHEVAHLRERRLGLVRDAGKTYTQSLTADPTLQPNTWALFRIFLGRGFWDNLVRLLDAEIRFAPLPAETDRADLLVEKGRILEDKLGRSDDALASYRAAVDAAPAHPAALLALLFAALRTGVSEQAEVALSGLVACAPGPEVRALLAVELARVQRGPSENGPDPDRARRAVDTLVKSLTGNIDQGPVLAELDRLSLLADSPDLRARVLDVLDSRLGRDDGARLDTAFPVAVYREKARLLYRRGAREAALAVLDRALRVAPSHPLLVADVMDLAEELGRPDTMAALLDDPTARLAPGKHEEGLLRRAEGAARAGALGEAIEALDRVPPESAQAPLARLARIRILARLGDTEGLAQAFTAEATRLVAGGDEDSLSDPARRHEAAHLYVRAATVRREFLHDSAGAGELLRQALALVPDFGPALEGLHAALADVGDWRGLAALFEEEAGQTRDPERRRALHASLAIIHRDLLREPREARRYEGPVEGDDVRSAARAADRAGHRLVAAGGGGAEEAIGRFRTLAERVTDPTVSANLRLLAGRLAAASGDAVTALALLDEAALADPTTLAAPAVEEAHRAAGRVDDRLRGLGHELRVADAGERRDLARALRFRLAFAAAEAGRSEEAVAALGPLRQEWDVAAITWSLQMAEGKPALQASLLAEPALAAASEAGGQVLTPGERLLALAEAREALGDHSGAASAFRDAGHVAEPGSTLATDAALGRLRAESAAGWRAGLREGWGRLVETLRGSPGYEDLRREADVSLLAAGREGASADTGPTPADGVRDWLRALRQSRDERAIDAGLDRLAEGSASPDAAAELWAILGLRRRLAGRGDPWPALEKAGASPLAQVLASELPGQGPRPAALAAARRQRAERLASSGPAAAQVAECLLLDEAAEAEAMGRNRVAAGVYGRVLDLRPTSVDATEGLRRLARAAGDRAAEATALLHLGRLLRDPRRAAERFAEAALILEESGKEDEAARAYAEVLGRVPDDDEAYRRLHALLTQQGDAAAVERLLSFRLQATADPEARIALLEERAALRLERLDRRREAIHDHRRVLALDGTRLGSLCLLARLAMEERRFTTAAGLYERAVGHAAEDEAVTLRLELAAAHDEGDALDEAVAVLRTAIELRPDDLRARERLIEIALRRHQLDLAVGELESLRSLAQNAEERAAVALRIGRVERNERLDRARAREAFRAALVDNPLSDAAAELVRTVGDDPLAAAEATVVDDVLARLRRELAGDPLHVRRLECVRDLARLRCRPDLADATGQLLSALGAGADRGRARDLSRPIGLATLNALGAPEGGASPGLALLVEVWNHLAEGAARAHTGDPAASGATRQTRVSPGSEPRLAWVEAASMAIGLPELSLHVVVLDDLAVTPLDAPDPILVLGRGVLGGDPASRFRVGRALALLRLRASFLERVSVEDLELTWTAAAWLAGAKDTGGLDPARVKAHAKALAKGLPRRDLKAIETYASRFASEDRDVVGWRDSVLRAADRFGLLVAGDLAEALRTAAGTNTPSAADLRGRVCLDLIRFALSDHYAAVRREAGLGKGPDHG